MGRSAKTLGRRNRLVIEGSGAGMPVVVTLDGLLTIALVPFFAFLFLVTAGVLAPGRRRSRGRQAIEAPRFLIVIPAHDEEPGIRSTVEKRRAGGL